jgi:coatomer subunit beta
VVFQAITNDDADRLWMCMRVLSTADRPVPVGAVFERDCRRSLNMMLTAQADEEASAQRAKEKPGSIVQPDEPVAFAQLAPRGETGGQENVFDASLSQAMGNVRKEDASSAAASKLHKVSCHFTGYLSPQLKIKIIQNGPERNDNLSLLYV